MYTYIYVCMLPACIKGLVHPIHIIILLRENCPNTELLLVRIFLYSD